MPKIAFATGLTALVFVLIAGAVTPAAAEFFGCNDQHSARSVTYRSYQQRAPSYRHASRYTHEFAAQSRPRASYSRGTNYASQRYWHERSRW